MVAGLPRERDIHDALAGITIKDAKETFGLPDVSVIASHPDYEIRHMADLAGMFRNAVAHGNLDFYSDPKNRTIARIQFSDRRVRRRDQVKQTRFTHELTIDDIEKILYAFRDIAQNLYDEATKKTA